MKIVIVAIILALLVYLWTWMTRRVNAEAARMAEDALRKYQDDETSKDAK